jgi:hypothetical protein
VSREDDYTKPEHLYGDLMVSDLPKRTYFTESVSNEVSLSCPFSADTWKQLNYFEVDKDGRLVL